MTSRPHSAISVLRCRCCAFLVPWLWLLQDMEEGREQARHLLQQEHENHSISLHEFQSEADSRAGAALPPLQRPSSPCVPDGGAQEETSPLPVYTADELHEAVEFAGGRDWVHIEIRSHLNFTGFPNKKCTASPYGETCPVLYAGSSIRSIRVRPPPSRHLCTVGELAVAAGHTAISQCSVLPFLSGDRCCLSLLRGLLLMVAVTRNDFRKHASKTLGYSCIVRSVDRQCPCGCIDYTYTVPGPFPVPPWPAYCVLSRPTCQLCPLTSAVNMCTSRSFSVAHTPAQPYSTGVQGTPWNSMATRHARPCISFQISTTVK